MNKKVFLILAILVGLILLIGGGYLAYQKFWSQKSKTTKSISTPTAPSSPSQTDNSAQILQQFNDSKKTAEENFAKIQNTGQSRPSQEILDLVEETKKLLEELKTFITANKKVLGAKGINTEEELKNIEEKLTLIASHGGSANPSSSQSPASSSSSLSLSLPFDKESFYADRMGIWPFCVHGGEHPEGHGGIDFDLKAGTEIKAAAPGSVEEMMYEESEGGYNIFLQHGSGYATGYIPIKDVQVQKGDQVNQGQVLGKAGDDGKGTTYVHFEVNNYQKGGRVCPYPFFNSTAKADFETMFSISHYPEQSSEPNICNCDLVPVSQR